MKIFPFLRVCAFLIPFILVLPLRAQPFEVLSVERVWVGEAHSAFSDLIRFDNAFFLAFREGRSHASPDGFIHIKRSEDGFEWETASIMRHPELDLRDPQFSIHPDGRLMISGAMAKYGINERGVEAPIEFVTFTAFSDDGVNWTDPEPFGEVNYWLWRFTWLEETAFGIAYQWPHHIRLQSTRDGRTLSMNSPVLMDSRSPNEATIQFDKNGRALVLLRMEGEQRPNGSYTRDPAKLGISKPPFDEWTWHDLGIYLGGPDFMQIPDGRWIVGARTRLGPARTSILVLDPETPSLELLQHLPSGGDTSYTGFYWHDDTLWVSYYSGHEGVSGIYLARLRVPDLSDQAEVGEIAPVVVPSERRPLPDFGVMLNEDGDFSFTDKDVAQSESNLRNMLRSMEDLPVRTLVHSLATGTDTLLYPSKVGSTIGWRVTEAEQRPPWSERMPIIRSNIADGLDPVRIAGEEASAMGMYFIPTLRMNDAHYVNDPFNNALTGEFWLENHETMTLGESPVAHEPFKHLLDFSHAEVRANRLDVIKEAINRYADLMAGLQLDFIRHPMFFPPGKAAERAHLMSELIADVRAALDSAGSEHGKYLSLHVRIPPAPRNAEWAGLEVERWMAEGWVDVIIPSPAMTTAFDMPVSTWAAMARPYDVAVYPALMDRNQFSWPLLREPSAVAYAQAGHRLLRTEPARGAIANYMAQGAAGVEFYNFNLPPTDLTREIIKAAADPFTGDRVYVVTPAHWNDDEDAYEYQKQIPATLIAGESVSFNLIVGESPNFHPDFGPRLRIGIGGNVNADRMRLQVRLNDTVISNDAIADGHLFPVAGPISRRGRNLHPPRADHYLHLKLRENQLPRIGRNELKLTLLNGDSAEVVEIQLAIFADQSVAM